MNYDVFEGLIEVFVFIIAIAGGVVGLVKRAANKADQKAGRTQYNRERPLVPQAPHSQTRTQIDRADPISIWDYDTHGQGRYAPTSGQPLYEPGKPVYANGAGTIDFSQYGEGEDPCHDYMLALPESGGEYEMQQHSSVELLTHRQLVDAVILKEILDKPLALRQ